MIEQILFVVVSTIILTQIDNKSNFSKDYMIPVIVVITTKYIIGDFDQGYSWTPSDILFWVGLVTLSYICVKIVDLKTS